MKYLPDANVVPEPLTARPSAGVLARIDAYAADLATSARSWRGVHFGLERRPPGSRRDRIRACLERRVRPTLPILPLYAAATEWQARERARLGRIGRSPSYADSQIAAIAAVTGLILVTRNDQDFVDVSEVVVENGFRPQTETKR